MKHSKYIEMKYTHSPISEYVRRHWLIIGIFVCIFLASIYPKLGSKQGPLKTEYSVKYGAVSLIFFISGLSTRSDSILHTFQHFRLHLFIQTFTFVVIPMITLSMVKMLGYVNVNPWILKGLITVACMPPPVSSAVILTRAARGNETAAIFNSVVGSFLGILLTPLLLLFFLGSTTVVPLLTTATQLGSTVLAPLAVGQAFRSVTGHRGHRAPLRLTTVAQAALLFIVYTTFCDTFHTPEMGLSAGDVITTVFLVVIMQICLVSISFKMAQCFKTLSKEDRVAALFCSTHKSLTLGIPILRIMFHGFSHLSHVSLPLLVYHPTQIILGGLLVSHLKSWTSDRSYVYKKRLPL